VTLHLQIQQQSIEIGQQQQNVMINNKMANFLFCFKDQSRPIHWKKCLDWPSTTTN